MRIKYLIIVILMVGLASCSSEKDFLVTIKTEYGDMRAILYEDTPEHRDNFLKLAREGFYDSLLFHRVIEDFMIQGGDPNSKVAQEGQALGSGGPGYTIPAEFSEDHFHKKGALSAARLGDSQNPEKRSSGSQFYVVQGKVLTEAELTTDLQSLNRYVQKLLQDPDYKETLEELRALYSARQYDEYQKKIVSLKPDVEEKFDQNFDIEVNPELLKAYTTVGGAPHLDGEYTVFGEVIDGLDIIDKIASQPTDRMNRPTANIRMFIEVEEMPKRRITRKYGYEYEED